MNANRLVWRAARSWVARSLRVAVASGLVVTAFALAAARVSYARTADLAMDFGDQLRQVSEGHLSGDVGEGAYDVQLNGQIIHASNGVTKRLMHDVLAFFQEQCNSNGGALADKLADMDGTLRTFQPNSGIPGYLTIRREQLDRGFVFCMGTDHEMTEYELVHRIKAASDGDFGKVGDVRYISVRQDGDQSDVVAAWTHGPFDVRAMFPKTGDVPGEDFANLPRPDGSRRVLASSVKGAPFGLNSYEVQGPPDVVLASVDSKLRTAGYAPVAMPRGLDPRAGRFYSLGDAVDVGVTAIKARDDVTAVNYVVSRGAGTVTRVPR